MFKRTDNETMAIIHYLKEQIAEYKRLNVKDREELRYLPPGDTVLPEMIVWRSHVIEGLESMMNDDLLTFEGRG